MKKIILILVICFTNSTQSQNYSDTSSENDLAIYLKKNISKRLLKKVAYKGKRNTISASFCVNKNNEIYDFSTTNTNKEVNKALELAFYNYPLAKLIRDNPNQGHKFRIQIISKKGSENIFNCSNLVSFYTTPTIKSCENYKQYLDQNKCFSEALKNHFACTINSKLLPKNNSGYILVGYSVSKKGVLYRKPKTNSKTKIYDKEVDRVLSLFKEKITPQKFNSNLRTTSGGFVINLQDQSDISCPISQIGDPRERDNLYDPLSAMLKKEFEVNSKDKNENDFSLFLKNNIQKDLLAKTSLNTINNQLILYFNLDSNKMTNLKTSARSKIVEKELISIIKKYPVDKLELPDDHHPLNTYMVQILSYENNQVGVKVSSKILYERIPIYKKCEKSKNYYEGKKCFSKKISEHINKNFDSKIASYLGLSPGKKRIYCTFKFDKQGNIKDIQVKAPHPTLKKEAYKTINKIPQLAMPAVQNGKAVSIRYFLPISLLVVGSDTQPTHNTDSYESIRYPDSNRNDF